jgi:hypothetical protein
MGVKYMLVRWKHSFADEPKLLYSELDEQRWEHRKVEVFPDGHMDFAEAEKWSGSTRLGLTPIPELREIAADAQFEPVEITKYDFEKVWTECQVALAN